MHPDNKNYILGRGKLYFQPFAPGTRTPTGGARYLGNSPALSTTSDTTTLDHYDADSAVRVKDLSLVTEFNRNGSLTLDHISPENLALWYGGSSQLVTQAAITSATQTITGARRGRRYQLGTSPSLPGGVRGLTTITAATDGGTPVALVAGTDFTADLETGAIEILPTSTVVTDTPAVNVIVTYSAAAVTYNQMTSGDAAAIEGELFYRATNAQGSKLDYLFPYVSIRPDGDHELKGDDVQSVTFNFDVLKRDDTTAAVYTNGRAGIFV